MITRFLRCLSRIAAWWLHLEVSYKDKNADLSMLSERIILFFKEKAFTVSTQQKGKTVIITAVPKPAMDIGEEIGVEICGDPNNFTVKFVSGKQSRALVRYGAFASLITGGYFMLKGLKSQEILEKLERKFWIYVDETVWFLSGQRAS